MKKHYLLSNLLLLALFASCNMQGYKLFVDGDENNTVLEAPDLAPQHPALTLVSDGSFYDTAMIAGVPHLKSQAYDRAVKNQLQAGKSEAYATAYGEQLAQGKTPQAAAAYAEEEEETRSDWTNNLLLNAYSAGLVAGHSHAVARRFATVCLAQLQQGQSHRWVFAYARKVVFEGKPHDEAYAYAEEIEQGLGGLSEVFSTMAQPGDQDEESLRTRAYKMILKIGASATWVQTYVNALVDAVETQGQSEEWAYAYAGQIANGETPTNAKTYADIVETQMKAGKNSLWSTHYAQRILAGSSAKAAEAYSDMSAPNIKETQKIQIEATAEAEKAGKSPEWAKDYATHRSQGMPPALAKKIANDVEEHMNQGKSRVWATAYVTSIVYLGNTPDQAKTFADSMREQRLGLGLEMQINTTADAERTGKSKDWQKDYIAQVTAGKTRDQAETYADTIETQRKAGKSHMWIKNYAMKIEIGQSHANAKTYADTIEAQMKKGKSKEWADLYATNIDVGFSPAAAENQADTVEMHAPNYANLVPNLSNMPKIVEEQIKAGKPFMWAQFYAMNIVMGKSPAEAGTQADESMLSFKVKNEIEAKAHKKAEQLGKSKEWGSDYADLIREGKPPAQAKILANSIEAHRKAGKSQQWILDYKTRVIHMGQSPAEAESYLNTVETKIKEGKSRMWAEQYAMAIAMGQPPALAKTMANYTINPQAAIKMHELPYHAQPHAKRKPPKGKGKPAKKRKGKGKMFKLF